MYIEYILQYEPCKLCIYQRLPYIAAIFISFIGFNYSNNDQILIVTIMIFALSSIISGYHFGIENNLFDISRVLFVQLEISSIKLFSIPK